MRETDQHQPERDDVAAIILAAGRSQRMGAFKPLLPFGDTTVVDSCLQNLRAGGVETVIVVVGHRADELRNHLKHSRVVFAVNPEPESEMSSSITCAVRELPKEAKAVLITPVDHPAVPSEVVCQLIDEWGKGQGLVKPTWQERGGHPVLIDLRFKDELLRLDSNLGLKALFDTHRDQVKRLPVDSNYIARDMDTWEDYAALHRDVFGVMPPEKAKPKEPGTIEG
ncbi:MAG TPA: nucleotidyltransferase family protein [Pyrinomonadaceae bacterium]|nr:nucleotidyltransferase family protein [Pyrinomonadaceae bacterium]